MFTLFSTQPKQETNVGNLGFHFIDKTLCGFETRQVVCFDCHGRIFENVACGFGSSMLNDKTSEATQINVLLTLKQTLFNCTHETFDNNGHFLFLHSCRIGNLVNDISFSHR